MSQTEDAKKKLTEAADTTAEAVKDAAQTARKSAQDFAQQTSESAKEAVKTTREAASNAFEKAQDGMRAVEKELSPAIDDLSLRAQEFCNRSIDFCAESSERARKQFQQAAETTTRYVVEQPGKLHLDAPRRWRSRCCGFLDGPPPLNISGLNQPMAQRVRMPGGVKFCAPI